MSGLEISFIYITIISIIEALMILNDTDKIYKLERKCRKLETEYNKIRRHKNY